MLRNIGILRETKSRWERRTPLLPNDIKTIQEKHSVDFLLQPSGKRIISENAYQTIGVSINQNLSNCDLLIGIKEVETENIIPGKIYLFFSHTVKGQAYNMPMLKVFLERNCTLIDYEMILDQEGKRFIYFSYHAGLAGALDTLWAYGQRLALENIGSPFQQVKRAFEYENIKEANLHLEAIGQKIKNDGLSQKLLPLVFGITGYGNVAQGVKRILTHLPVQWIAPDQLAHTEPNPSVIYGTTFKEADMVAPIDNNRKFDLQEYYNQPQKYKSKFNTYLPYLTVLFNASYWDAIYPRHVTKADIKHLFSSGSDKRLKVIGDISCDIDGGIECTIKATDPGNPVYVYDVNQNSAVDGIAGNGPVIMAVDILPAEIPMDASTYFSSKLTHLLPQLINVDFSKPTDKLKLDSRIKNAVITHRGELTPKYRYLLQYLDH
jgi:alanine dehydrogenase